ncbi:hypothetical protein OK074_7590 [Actinobacteria bacterium OK074]|nr:hypothetical protein OK074_7590 [Actinobacteria bacterium OK074]
MALAEEVLWRGGTRVRVVLIGGTSHAGKTTVGVEIARRLGYEYRSTDGLARHPGRPWRTEAGGEVPAHVAEHYRTLCTEELITSVLDHYGRLWPRIEELVTGRVYGLVTGREYDDGGADALAVVPGLVLEGSALWPERVAGLLERVPGVAAVWLTADEGALRERIRAGGRYGEVAGAERQLIDSFAERTVRYQELMREAVDRRGLAWVEGAGVDEVLGRLGVLAGPEDGLGKGAEAKS